MSRSLCLITVMRVMAIKVGPAEFLTAMAKLRVTRILFLGKAA